MELIIGISGASGVIYGVNLLEVLKTIPNCSVNLIISDNAKQILSFETQFKPEQLPALVDHYYENNDLTAGIASGSMPIDSMVIIPCSMSTAAKVNTGIADNLITRAADVCIKEQRRLIIVPRETPCNSTHLKNLYELSNKGVSVLPAMPGFYHRPKSIDDLVHFITGKILDQLGIDHELYKRWSGQKLD
jgi:4-hydroxy-3-polyprenylbenzoate decarboxylase